MKNTTSEVLNLLIEDLKITRANKVSANGAHNVQLVNGIQLIKEQFESIAEVKSLTTQKFMNGITKKLKGINGKDFKLSDDFKRVLKISHKLISGYKVKKELLTIAQIEQLINFDKSLVNNLMSFEEELYLISVKELINNAKEVKTTKIFSVKKAKNYKQQ